MERDMSEQDVTDAMVDAAAEWMHSAIGAVPKRGNVRGMLEAALAARPASPAQRLEVTGGEWDASRDDEHHVTRKRLNAILAKRPPSPPAVEWTPRLAERFAEHATLRHGCLRFTPDVAHATGLAVFGSAVPGVTDERVKELETAYQELSAEAVSLAQTLAAKAMELSESEIARKVALKDHDVELSRCRRMHSERCDLLAERTGDLTEAREQLAAKEAELQEVRRYTNADAWDEEREAHEKCKRDCDELEAANTLLGMERDELEKRLAQAREPPASQRELVERVERLEMAMRAVVREFAVANWTFVSNARIAAALDGKGGGT